MTIRSKPANSAYRDGWDAIFGKVPKRVHKPGGARVIATNTPTISTNTLITAKLFERYKP